MKRIFSLFLIVLLLGNGAGLLAQSEPESSVLVIESQESGRQVKVHVGDRLDYQARGGTMQRKERVTAVQDSSVTIGQKEIPFSELEAVQPKGNQAGLGLGVLIGSAVALPISLLLWVVSLLAALDNPTRGQRVLMVVLGLTTLVLFPLGIILGIILVATSRRKFRLGSYWRLRKG